MHIVAKTFEIYFLAKISSIQKLKNSFLFFPHYNFSYFLLKTVLFLNSIQKNHQSFLPDGKYSLNSSFNLLIEIFSKLVHHGNGTLLWDRILKIAPRSNFSQLSQLGCSSKFLPTLKKILFLIGKCFDSFSFDLCHFSGVLDFGCFWQFCLAALCSKQGRGSTVDSLFLQKLLWRQKVTFLSKSSFSNSSFYLPSLPIIFEVLFTVVITAFWWVTKTQRKSSEPKSCWNQLYTFFCFGMCFLA